MPSLQLTNLASFRAYFEAIATGPNHHVDLKGFKWGDEDVVKNDNRSDLAHPFLWTGPYEQSRYSDRSSDNVVKFKRVKLNVFTSAASESYADQNTAVELCESIMDDIVAKIIKDKAGRDNAGVWEMIVAHIDAANGRPVVIQLGSTKYHGWELTIEIGDNKNLQYNAAKWTT